MSCAAGFEEVREHPHLYPTSTGPEEAAEKYSLNPTAMRAVEKHSPLEQCYSPEPRNQTHVLPYPVFHGCLLLGPYLLLYTTETAAAAVSPRSALRAAKL